jgi:hypothetical protein
MHDIAIVSIVFRSGTLLPVTQSTSQDTSRMSLIAALSPSQRTTAFSTLNPQAGAGWRVVVVVVVLYRIFGCREVVQS